ncbi:MAG TPA: serpin family protein [Candidatus Binataceae bacterium]
MEWRSARAQPSAGAEPAPVTTAGLSTSVNDFGLLLLRTLTDGSGANVMVSPLSVSLALAMTYNGAAGDTKAAIAKTLGAASLSDEDFNRNNRSLLDTIQKADPAVQMEIANALWVQSGFSIRPEFLKLSHDYFDASPESVDFARDPAKAAATINGWVKEKTRDKIPEIIKATEITGHSTALVLTDAVYFKGRWVVPFDKTKTELKTFHLQGARSVTTPMMAQEGKFEYAETESFQAIRLPYGNNRFAMYVFLPRTNSSLPDFIRSLDEAHWREWTGKLAERQGTIVLPKFESTYGQLLNAALKAMGMGVAFERSSADFSRIHPPHLWIDFVEHKTYMKVDEEGTEAAAATAVGMSNDFVRANPPPPFKMIVDHPFFCAIAEQQSGALLFAGVVTDPTQR